MSFSHSHIKLGAVSQGDQILLLLRPQGNLILLLLRSNLDITGPSLLSFFFFSVGPGNSLTFLITLTELLHPPVFKYTTEIANPHLKDHLYHLHLKWIWKKKKNVCKTKKRINDLLMSEWEYTPSNHFFIITFIYLLFSLFSLSASHYQPPDEYIQEKDLLHSQRKSSSSPS